MSTTNPINGNTIQAVADNLIMETPDNPEKAVDEVVEAIVDEQPEVTEEVVEEQDDVEAQANEEDLGEEYEEAEQDEVQPEPQYKVKVDGIETEVTLDELQRGYSGQKYIQKGMAENAETKKTLDEAQQQITQERQVLQHLVQQLQNGDIPKVPEYPSEELRASDPLGYLEKEAEYRRAVDKRQQFEQQLSVQMQQQQQVKQKQEQDFLNQQAMRLAEWMPEFANPEKRSVFIQEVATKAKKHYNLSDDQINTVKYAEEVMVLNDAIKWRELQANKGKAQQKAEGARPVVKPAAKRAASAGKVSKAKKAEANMRAKGDLDSVANYLLNP